MAAAPAAAAPSEPAAEPEKGFAGALTALLDMAKAAKGKKIEDEAVRSLLVQAANLCREMLGLAPLAEELSEDEAIGLAKELEAMAPAVIEKGTDDERAAFAKLSKAVMKALGPISGE